MAKLTNSPASTPLHKEDALLDIVALAERHHISIEEITDIFQNISTQGTKTSSSILSKLLGYIGGIFVFAGIGVFISMYWADFSSAARVIITLGTGIITFMMGLACLTDSKYERAATPLFLIGALLQSTGILVMLQEYSSGGDPRHGVLFMASYMVIQQGATFWAKQRSVLAFSTILFSCVFLITLLDIWHVDDELVGIIIGISLICIAYALNKSRHIAIAPFWYFFGAVSLLWAVFETVEDSPIELVYLGVSAFIIYLSTVVRSRVLLFVGTLSMLIYIGYYTSEHFADTVGWPIALVIVGIALIAMSSLAIRLNNKYISSND